MAGRVDVGGAVGAELADLVVGPALAVAQQLAPDPEEALDQLGALLVVLEVDLDPDQVECVRG